jgi:hypothetical protein
MSEAHRGILPHCGQLLAFGNRGQQEVFKFRLWLKANGYVVEDFLADKESSWVMLVTPPAKMKDTCAVSEALWDASDDSPFRKGLQRHIADLNIQLHHTRQLLLFGRSWFTAKEVRETGQLVLWAHEALREHLAAPKGERKRPRPARENPAPAKLPSRHRPVGPQGGGRRDSVARVSSPGR